MKHPLHDWSWIQRLGVSLTFKTRCQRNFINNELMLIELSLTGIVFFKCTSNKSLNYDSVVNMILNYDSEVNMTKEILSRALYMQSQ